MDNPEEDKTVQTIQEKIQSLYGVRDKDDFTEITILGSDINQIRHLFYHLKAEEISLEVSYLTDVYTAQVLQVQEIFAELYVPGFEEGGLRRCRLTLEAFRDLYQFEVSIHSIARDRITIRIPAYIQTAQRRKNARAFVSDLFMKVNIVYQHMFNYRDAAQLAETRFPSIIRELRRDEPDLYLINRIITEALNEISPYFDFEFYGENRPEDFRDRMLLDLNQTIYIHDTSTSDSYFQPRASSAGLANFQKEFMRLSRMSSAREAEQYFEKLRQQDSRNFIHNYVLAPLKIFNEIVGRIFIHASSLEKNYISFEQARLIDVLAQLLSYAMTKNAIYRSYFQHTMIRVSNISLTGLLFELQDDALFDFLTFHDHIVMKLSIRHNTLVLKGVISRYYPSENGYMIGVNFTDAAPDDYRILENFIYERVRAVFH